MKTITIARGVIGSMFLFTITGIVQACYYESDPVKTPTGYDVPITATDNDCYYGGDPVMETSGHYSTPVILSEGSYYYTADVQDDVIPVYDSQEISEFSAFEHEALTDDNPVAVESITGDELGDHEWAPQSWNMSY